MLASCEDLGNPPRRYTTEPVRSRAFGIELVTHTDSISAYRASDLVAAYPGRTVLGEAAAREGDTVATLVQIVPRVPIGDGIRGHIAVTTTFRFENGTAAARTFYPNLNGIPWLALFYLPQPPVAAVTAIAR